MEDEWSESQDASGEVLRSQLVEGRENILKRWWEPRRHRHQPIQKSGGLRDHRPDPGPARNGCRSALGNACIAQWPRSGWPPALLPHQWPQKCSTGCLQRCKERLQRSSHKWLAQRECRVKALHWGPQRSGTCKWGSALRIIYHLSSAWNSQTCTAMLRWPSAEDVMYTADALFTTEWNHWTAGITLHDNSSTEKGENDH